MYEFIFLNYVLIMMSSIITFIGLLIIAMGSAVAIYEFFSVIMKKGLSGRVFNEVRLDYSHYLILGLDFYCQRFDRDYY